MKDKLTILIVTSGNFAVPAIKGGSIETLVTALLDMNEQTPKFEFIVGSCYDEEAVKASASYQHASFIYYKKNHKYNFAYKCWAVFYYLMRFFKIHCPKFHYIWQVYRATKNKDIDLVIVEEGDAWAYNFLMKKFGVEKMVYHSHSVLHADRHFERNYDSVIACSQYVLNENFSKNSKYNKSQYVLVNCINDVVFSKQIDEGERQERRRALGIKTDDLVYLFVGRISKDKGVLECVKAFQQFNHAQAKLIIAGSAMLNHTTLTPYEKEVKEAIANSQNIIQLGFVPQTELCKVYQMADIFVAPSSKEAAGLMNIEAMFSGLPIISVNSGGVPEYVIHNQNGLLLSRYDALDELVEAMNTLASQPKLRAEFAANNRRDCQKYTRNKYFDDFGSIIHQIVDSK